MKDAPAKAHNETGYVAFLRGINLGGHKQINMGELKGMFESMGFQNVRTLINSGNVVFEALEQARSNLVKKIEQELKKSFGHEVAVILRTIREIQELVDSDPFKKVKVTPETRLYVTFLAEKPNSNMKIPYESPEKDFKIISVQGDAVFSVVTLNPKRGTTEAMGHLEKGFGKKITTRNWNTVVKILKK
jgi:uncharacterized protein (DUF1697 family)